MASLFCAATEDQGSVLSSASTIRKASAASPTRPASNPPRSRRPLPVSPSLISSADLRLLNTAGEAPPRPTAVDGAEIRHTRREPLTPSCGLLSDTTRHASLHL